MILQFDEHDYIDISKIVALRWLPIKNIGTVVFEGERLATTRTDFNKIEEAFLWYHLTHIYGPDKKVIKLVKVKGEEDGSRSKTVDDTADKGI